VSCVFDDAVSVSRVTLREPAESITNRIPLPNRAIALCTRFCGNQKQRMVLSISMETVSLGNSEVVEDFSSSQFEQVFVRSKAVVSRRVAGETLIVPVRGKVGDLASIYSFNQTGSLIWQALESPKTASELARLVEQEYAVSREQAEQDVNQFLRDMQSVDLVQVREEVSMSAMNSTSQGEMLSSRSH